MTDKLDEAFATTTNMLFGKPLAPLSKYSSWLSLRVPRGKTIKSCLGQGEAYLPDYGFFKKIPAQRTASLDDLERVWGKKIAEEDAQSLSSLIKALKKFAYFVPTYMEGRNINVQNTFGYIDCMNVRDSFDSFTSKNSAYAFSIMAEALFGGYRIAGASFSIHCYNCIKVQRCFEMDGAKNCSDSLFCHNVENLEHCMFCFNTKSKRYAVGNVEVGREIYIQLKNEFLKKIVPKLEKKGKLDFDIYDVLCT
ncbi:MAG: hypothetical protein ABIH99_02090, partial [Candidatus Micrarchaeota archaeon]